MTRRRKVRPEEQALWDKVASKAQRLHPEKPLSPEDFVEHPKPGKSRPKSKPVFETLPRPATPQHPRTTVRAAPSIADEVRGQPLQMDKKAFQQLKRGKLRPEGKLDLHGMTLERAHPVLTRFILGAQAQGKRLVLVVTGKGKDRDEGGPIPTRHGVLRHQVPQWLSMPPLSSAVLQVSQAHIRHGGGGAYYVYLRRNR